MPWHEYKKDGVTCMTTQKKDRSFVHGILIGGMCAMVVCGAIFGYEYAQLINDCRALAGLLK